MFSLTPPAIQGSPWTETILYTFRGGSDGNGPSGLVRGKVGALNGTTIAGGTYGYGTAFQLKPPALAGGAWMESALYCFTRQNGDGWTPNLTHQ